MSAITAQLISGGSSSLFAEKIDPLKDSVIIAENLKNEIEATAFIENLHVIIDNYFQKEKYKNSLMTPLCNIIINFPFGGDVLRKLVELVEKLVYFDHIIPEIPEDLLSKLCLNIHSSDTDSRFNFLKKLLENNCITTEIYQRILQDIENEMAINSSLDKDYKNIKLSNIILFLNDKFDKQSEY